MKRTENISLAGYAFTIEEDAYIELENYIKDIRAGFEGNSSADEITTDIEERIAELLSERCASGIVVNLSMIEGIKERIGNPEELAGEEVDNDSERTAKAQEVKDEKKSWKNRKIYRNIDERILGGVCGGLGAYFGLDKVIFRVLFLIFFLVGFSDEGLFCIPMVLYICLWIAMPAARTVDQKCEMKGKPIDLRGFSSKEFDINREVKEVAQSPAGRTIKRVGGVFLGLMLLICGLCGLIACIFIPSMPSIIENQLNLYHPDAFELSMMQVVTDTTFWTLTLVSMVLMFVGMLYGGIMLTFDLKSPSWKPGLVLFISWVISIFVIAAWVVKTIADALPGMII
jgi:phage shock protein PspC (stress-responsive transcriptional regulator)